MSLNKLIGGASDVLYRNYEGYRTDRNSYKIRNKYCRKRMLSYLGEQEDITENQDKEMNNLVSVCKGKLNQVAALDKDISNVLQKFIQSFTDLESFKSKSIGFPKDCYNILCFSLGSETEVKTLRSFFDILDDCVKINKCYRNVSSGGRAEGNAIQDADYDFMTVLEQITVDEGIRQGEKPMIIYDMENSYPGFVHLRIQESQYASEIFHYWGEETSYGRLVSNTRFKEYFMQGYRDSDKKIHGPCISTTGDTVDHMFCLKSTSWPSVARQWINRTRLTNWPSTEVVSAVIDQGILFAPIGSKFGSSSDCSYEWRISFSMPEKILIRSFNHTQLLCYKCIKYLKKDILKPILGDDFLCSYFFKTALFWMCEQYPQSIWCPENIIQCFLEFQRLFSYWIRYEVCPHYFIPDNNLFQGLLKDKNLKTKLESMFNFSNLLSIVLSSPHYAQTISRCSVSEVYSNAFETTQFQQNMKSILNSYRYLKATLRVCTLTQIYGIIRKCLFRLRKYKFSYFVKGIYLSILCLACQTCAQLKSLKDETQGNKSTYAKRKQVLSHLMIGTKSDAANGWCLVSSYFYKTHQYQLAIEVAELVLKKASVDYIVPMENVDYTLKYIHQNVSKWDRKLSFLTLMSQFCLDFVYLLPEPAWCLDELNADIGYRMMDIPPIPYAHFVRFLSCYRKGSILQMERVIKDLLCYVRSGHYIEYPFSRIHSYGVLAKAYLATGDKKAATYWIRHVHRLFTESFPWKV